MYKCVFFYLKNIDKSDVYLVSYSLMQEFSTWGTRIPQGNENLSGVMRQITRLSDG